MVQDHSSDYKKVGHVGTTDGISIVIPVSAPDEPVTQLLKDLRLTAISDDIILCGPAALAEVGLEADGVRSLVSPRGTRAASMNHGAYAARNDWLWFLHADSRLPRSLDGLFECIEDDRGALWWFNLRFHDAPYMMAFNTLGVWFRSHCLRCPFGDQGFLLPRRLFLSMGGFPESFPYGEDHVFTWQCRRAGMPLRCTGMTLQTSARRYRDHGWAATTGRHLRLWAKQARQQRKCL